MLVHPGVVVVVALVQSVCWCCAVSQPISLLLHPLSLSHTQTLPLRMDTRLQKSMDEREIEKHV